MSNCVDDRDKQSFSVGPAFVIVSLRYEIVLFSAKKETVRNWS